MQQDPILFSLFLIFSGAAIIATLALFARQSMLVSYILLGGALGPWGIGLVSEPEQIAGIAHIGVIFLLFLLGLNLHPQQLFRLLRETLLVTLGSSLAFAAVGFACAMAFGFSVIDATLVGAASMFSSTIIGLKLLPTTTLHQQHTGEVIISILLLQDILAILILLFLQAYGGEGALLPELGRVVLVLPLSMGLALLVARYVLVPLFMRFDTIQEYVFLVAIGWCLGFAELAAGAGLSAEIGAFIAGVALASSPISTFIAESLKPLRDFFLILFFFSLGAGFDPSLLEAAIIPALVLVVALVLFKPWLFRLLLQAEGEKENFSREVGVRLGQISEFSLFIAMLAAENAVISAQASGMIQLATLLSFILSSYWIMLRYPTPIAVTERLRRD
jgi:Kef-type K+ transport system membrane component KefB